MGMSNVVSMAIPSGFLVCIGTKDERILSSDELWQRWMRTRPDLHSVSYITGLFEEGGTANELNRWFA